MIFIQTNNIIVLPLTLGIWAIDIFLALVAVRWALEWSPAIAAGPLCQGLRPVTEAIPARIHNWLQRRLARPLPRWLPWALVLMLAVTLRYFLLWILLRTA